jgi:hypothetical protein
MHSGLRSYPFFILSILLNSSLILWILLNRYNVIIHKLKQISLEYGLIVNLTSRDMPVLDLSFQIALDVHIGKRLLIFLSHILNASDITFGTLYIRMKTLTIEVILFLSPKYPFKLQQYMKMSISILVLFLCYNIVKYHYRLLI